MKYRDLTVVAMLTLLGTGALAPVTGASADEAGRRVLVADLDLRSTAGIEVLYGRLRTAAVEVCAFHEARGYAERQRARRCMSATLDAAVKGFSLKGAHPLQSEIQAKRRLLQLARADRHGYGENQPFSRSHHASL